jgi:hypothetical protein
LLVHYANPCAVSIYPDRILYRFSVDRTFREGIKSLSSVRFETKAGKVMAISRIIWKSSFTAKNIPSWRCPTCHNGILEADETDITIIESETSKSARDHEYWEPEWISGSFNGTIRCNNKLCKESVFFLGEMVVDRDYVYDEEYGPSNSFSEFLHPKAFSPTLHAFTVHNEVPQEIKNAIVDSFKVYWMDTSSCGNKIRVVAELIMDEQGIPKTYIDKKKRKGYTLHKRIELFKVTNPNEADLLMAIKWIGNFGSHASDLLTKDDVLDAYEILELVISKLYEREDSIRVKKLSKDIVKRKKPLGLKSVRKKKK